MVIVVEILMGLYINKKKVLVVSTFSVVYVVYGVYVSFVILSLRHYVNYAKPLTTGYRCRRLRWEYPFERFFSCIHAKSITTGPTGYPGNSWIESKLIDPALRESMLIEQPAFRAEYSSF